MFRSVRWWCLAQQEVGLLECVKWKKVCCLSVMPENACLSEKDVGMAHCLYVDLYLVYMLFGMPSLHLFISLVSVLS